MFSKTYENNTVLYVEINDKLNYKVISDCVWHYLFLTQCLYGNSKYQILHTRHA